MEDFLMLAAIAFSAAAGFIAGMYVTTQISSWIDTRIQHKQFMKNLDEFDKNQKKK